MVTSENFNLSQPSRERLLQNIKEVEDFLSRKFPKYTIGLCFFLLSIILLLISRYEDYGVAVLLKFATVFPFTAIVVVLLSYFHKRGDARKIRKYYKSVLRLGTYTALKVRSRWCGSYKEGLSEYYLFEFDHERQILLNLSDFRVDKDLFPNDSFIIPPYELIDVVGNEITCLGSRINSSRYVKIRYVLPVFKSFQRGQTMVIPKI